ncbi:hypothetical protein PsYK624_025910 [Phanerochaete sordida]|uniref:F-box domain-containing protein n=1 Tax=Phanerochaete sordida TaxID=48140 RepID=A0A9P3G1G8_9APHY|nr:hypothetical protein PsYK624_025910 [Phanerochaete sordida]
MGFKAYKRRVEELDAQGALLQRRIEDLTAELESARHAYSENRRERAASTPLHALPDDVLKLVFDEAYDHDPYDDEYEFHILTMTHVSRRLRQIALSLPHLWRYIDIGPPTPFLELVLSRTGSLPLYITCYNKYQPDRDGLSIMARQHILATRYVEQLGLLLRGYSHRIAHMSILGHVSQPFLSILPVLRRHTLPICEFLQLATNPDALRINIPQLLPQCPQLDALWITAIPTSFVRRTFECLMRLSISEIKVSRNDLREAARACPNLTWLDLADVRLTGGDSGPVRFPHLEKLRLGQVKAPEAYLDLLDMPALSSLVIWSLKLSSRNVAGADPGPLRPFTNVRNLALCHVLVPAALPYDGNILQYAPNATTLQLDDSAPESARESFTEYFLKAEPPPLPALKTLFVTEAERGGQNILRVVEHRARHELPLKEVQFGKDSMGEVDGELLQTLKRHVDVTTTTDFEVGQD